MKKSILNYLSYMMKEQSPRVGLDLALDKIAGILSKCDCGTFLHKYLFYAQFKSFSLL